jgi:N-formylglutamate amidohydrolase
MGICLKRFKRTYPETALSCALVPGKYYRMDARVQAIMVEINRGLYMNERSGAKKPDFVVIKEKLQTALRSLIEAIAERVMDQQVGPRNRLHSW